jgi:hypothetical protein
MFNPTDKIKDCLNDKVGNSIKKIQSISRWTKDKQLARKNLISLLEKQKYISFCGHVDKYHLSCVGESCLYDIPLKRRGHLKVFAGQRIRLVCVWSGRYDRLYMAGKI